MWNAKEGLKFAMFMLLLFMTVLSGCSGGTADNTGKGDAVGNGKTKEDENNRKSGGASSGEEVEITVWTWPDNDKTFEITVPIFEELNPDIKVNVQAFPSNQYADKLLATIVSGSGPDVAMVEIGNVAQFKTQNAFEDLSREPYNAGQYANQYASFSWDYVTGEDGYIFALPKNTGPAAMFYRRDLFQAAGLPTEPDAVHERLKTWDDYLEAGRELSVKGERWMVATPGELLDAFRGQAGISNFDEDGNLQLDHPVYQDALDYIAEAKNAGMISPFTEMWTPEWNATMANGTVATYFSGNWFGGLLKSLFAPDAAGKWGVTFAPAYNGVSEYNRGGDFIGILKTSEHKEASWKFIQFVTQNMDSLENMYVNNDLYPAWTPALDQEWMNQPDDYFAGQVLNDIFSTVSENMEAPVTNPYDPAVADALSNAVTNIMRTDMNPQEALERAKQEAEAKIR